MVTIQTANAPLQNDYEEVQTMNLKPSHATMERLNRLIEGCGYSVYVNLSQYALCDRNNNEIARSKKLTNLHPFVGSIVAERDQMIAASKDVDIRSIIKPLRKVTFTSPDDNVTKTYHILAIVEWDRVVVKYWNVKEFVFEVVPMQNFVEWYIMGRLS